MYQPTDCKQYQAELTLSAGGFPCQDISFAGKGAGIEGERSGLWSELARLIGDIRPRYAILENVAALLGRGLSRVLGDLAEIGYDAEWHCIPASAVGAPHERDRAWVVAYAERAGLQGPILSRRSILISERKASTKFGNRVVSVGPIWGELGAHLRVGDGLSRWTHNLAALGNAVVPQIPEMIGNAILAAEKQEAA